VSAWTRGVETVRTFFEQEEGSIFRDFAQTSFMDGPLKCIFTLLRFTALSKKMKNIA